MSRLLTLLGSLTCAVATNDGPADQSPRAINFHHWGGIWWDNSRQQYRTIFGHSYAPPMQPGEENSNSWHNDEPIHPDAATDG